MSRRATKKDLTRTQILSASADLFAEQGYEQTSIDDITKQADIAKGTFYYHFDSKEDVVVALRHDSMSGIIQSAMDSLNNGTSPILVIEEVFLEQAGWTEKNPELTKVFFEQRIHQFLFRENDTCVYPKTDTHLPTNGKNTSNGNNGSENKMRLFQLIFELVLAGQKRKELRQDIDARELTQIIMATFLHAQGSWIGGYSGTSLIDKVHRWFHIILDGLYDQSY